MIIRFGSWLVLLAAYCVALADLDVSRDEIQFDIHTFVDNVSFQSENCSDTNPCQNGGTCTENVCSCLNGTSGHLCKTIDDCSSRCGNANCFYNVTSRDIYCTCNAFYAFDDYSKMCKDCYCGIWHAKDCSYAEGKKKCTCAESYADLLGTCSNCNCNFNFGCEFDARGLKTCKCPKGYVQLHDDCRECNCGEHGNCTRYSDWEKSCRCEEGYLYVEEYGTCQECDCGENGDCTFNAGNKQCYCERGFAENQKGKCEACNCSPGTSCVFNKDILYTKECICPPGYANLQGRCKECDCGDNGRCTFNAGNKQCNCNDGFAENYRGLCQECDCKMSDSNCTMDGFLKNCQCPRGFEPSKDIVNPVCIDKDECLRPEDNDCPPFSTKCVNKWGSYGCVCKEGFEVMNKYGDIKRDGCKDIDECLDSPCVFKNTRCVNSPGSYRCECKAGYSVEKDSYQERFNYCNEDERPWRTASIVAGCLFGFVSLGLLIGICNKHCDF